MFVVAFGVVLIPVAAQPRYPQVEIKYSAVFDRNCAGWVRAEINQELIAATLAKVPVFQRQWDKDAPNLLGTTVKEIGRPFRAREVAVSLTVCPIMSQAVPLILTVQRFIEPSDGSSPQPLFQFSAALFHELLRIYIGDSFDFREREGRSGFDRSDRYRLDEAPLMQKYQAELPAVKSTMYVKAIEKLVYLKLGWTKELDAIIAFESTRPNQKRAWEIVNHIEGHLPFVAELKHYYR